MTIRCMAIDDEPLALQQIGAVSGTGGAVPECRGGPAVPGA